MLKKNFIVILSLLLAGWLLYFATKPTSTSVILPTTTTNDAPEAGQSAEKVLSATTNGKELHPAVTPIEKELQVFEEVNAWRVGNGMQPFTIDPNLCILAEIRINQLPEDWSHDQFVPLVYAAAPTMGFKRVGENLARDFYAGSPLEAWVNSPLHYKNLAGDYDFSCLQEENGYYVQMFASY